MTEKALTSHSVYAIMSIPVCDNVEVWDCVRDKRLKRRGRRWEPISSISGWVGQVEQLEEKRDDSARGR